MNPIIRFFKNIPHMFMGVKIVDDLIDKLVIRCPKCSSTSSVYKYYGEMVFVCECGYRTKIDTGEDRHKFLNKESDKKIKSLSKDEINERKKQDRYEIFYKHINDDLKNLYIKISDNHDVTIQVDSKKCLNILKGKDLKNEYEDVLKYLKSFLNLHNTPIKLTWERLNKEKTLSDPKNEINIMGTTYPLPMGSQMFYTIYLNPNFLEEKEKLLNILSHEITHVYSDTNNIKFISPDKDRGNKEYSEQMTDLLGVVLGMGKLMNISDSDEGWFTGYLTNKMVRKSCELWDSEFLSGKNKIVKSLVDCPSCSQKLRVPIRKDRLKIICPKCKHEL